MSLEALHLAFNIFVLAAALVTAYALSWGVALWTAGAGERWGVLSNVTDRSSHTRPTSRLGGLGIAAGFFGGAGLLVYGLWILPRSPEGWGGNLSLLGWLGLGSLAMFAVGLADDLWDLPATAKFFLQLATLVPLAFAGLRFIDLRVAPIPGLSPNFVSTLGVFLWVVFFVNAFNFMDGMDGFAASFAKEVCFWIVMAGAATAAGLQSLLAGEPVSTGLITYMRIEFFIVPVIGAACAGFLRVNRPPARVFMGDGGSHLLGWLLAVQVVLADGDYYFATTRHPLDGALIPAPAIWLMLLPFTFDVIVTLLRRARLGENLLAPHRSHLYQRLMILGKSHREVLQLNRVLFKICGALGLFYAITPGVWPRVGAWVAGSALMIGYWRWVLKKERTVQK